MEHTWPYAEALKLYVAELKLMTRSHFIEILKILSKYICIQCQCPVDRVFRKLWGP